MEPLDGHTALAEVLNQLGTPDIKEHLQLFLGRQGEAGYRPSISGLATFFHSNPAPTVCFISVQGLLGDPSCPSI